jgi:hypothetical protein
MTWNETFLKTAQPTLEQFDAYIFSPLWRELCTTLENSYGTQPRIEHSVCSGAPGWNLKYRKGGRALCTLYPHKGFFTALVSIGTAEAAEAEYMLPTCSEAVRTLYGQQTASVSGGRWLMIDVTDAAILADVLRLISLRVKPKHASQSIHAAEQLH